MTDRFYIDKKDAFTEYGVFVAEGGYNELVAYPPLKAVKSNDWQEEDGIDPDLSAPVLDTREFAMKFAFTGTFHRIGAFIELLSGKSYHTFCFKEIGRTYRLRLVSHTSLETARHIGLITLRFANDFPMEGYTYLTPQSRVPACGDYEIDGVKLSDYGVRVLAGSLSEIGKAPAVKPNMLRNIASQQGAIYDDSEVTFRSKDVKVNCLLRAATLEELWRNYDALLYDLVHPDNQYNSERPGERMLYVEATGEEYPCYYKSCSVTSFYATDKIWLTFSITLVFTSFRIQGEEYLLASEDDRILITEQGDNTINLSIYGN